MPRSLASEVVPGMTALMAAARSLQPFCLRLLLGHGADPSLKDRRGKTALHYAAEGEEEIGAFLLASDMIDAGADVNEKDKVPCGGIYSGSLQCNNSVYPPRFRGPGRAACGPESGVQTCGGGRQGLRSM